MTQKSVLKNEPGKNRNGSSPVFCVLPTIPAAYPASIYQKPFRYSTKRAVHLYEINNSVMGIAR